jgi:hypothetical protein
LIAPVVEHWVGGLSSRQVAELEDAEQLAASSLLKTHSPSFFSAEANPLAFFAMLVGAIAAIVEILQYLRIGPSFSSTVRYAESSGCLADFQRVEAASRQIGHNVFSGVSRSPLDNNLAVLVAGTSDTTGRSITRAEVAAKYSSYGAVDLRGIEPDVINAAAAYASTRHRLTGTALANALAVIQKVDRYYLDSHGQTIQMRSFRGPQGGFILHDPRATDEYVGRVKMHIPGITDQDRLDTT